MKNIFYSVIFAGLLVSSLAQAQVSGATSTDNVTEIGQLNTISPKADMPCTKFARSVSYGTRGSDVSALQLFLIEKGYLNTGATSYFGVMTKNALIKFQKENNLPPTGFFGEKSRGIVNNNCKGGITKVNPPGICTTPDCKPTGIMCTMVARLCDDGSLMPRDSSCGWHPEMCKPKSVTPTTTPGICTAPECKYTKPTPCPMIMCVEGQPCTPCQQSTSTISASPAPTPITPSATGTCAGLVNCKPTPICLSCGGGTSTSPLSPTPSVTTAPPTMTY